MASASSFASTISLAIPAALPCESISAQPEAEELAVLERQVDLFKQIRREYEFGVGTIAGAAKKLGVHRRMVREAIGSALPKPRKKTERPRWKLKAALECIDAILVADRNHRGNSGTLPTGCGNGFRLSCRSARSANGPFANTCAIV